MNPISVILNKQFIGDSNTLRAYLEEKLLPRFIKANILDRNSFADAMSTSSVKLKSNRNDIERDIANNVLFKYFNFMNGRNYTDLASRFVNVSLFSYSTTVYYTTTFSHHADEHRCVIRLVYR